MALNLTKRCSYIKFIKIFENESHFYFIGEQNLRRLYSIFTIKKITFTKENIDTDTNLVLSDLIEEHKKDYDKEQLREFNAELAKRSSTMLKNVDNTTAIFGFVKFFLGYYAILTYDVSHIGKINKYVINKVDKLKLIPLFYSNDIKQTTNYDLENKYLSIFKEGFEFTKPIYYSYTYNLTKTLQRNFVENLKTELVSRYENNFYKTNEKKIDIKKETNTFFHWNHYHQKEFFNVIVNKIWCVYFIHGFFEQIECDIYGLRLLVSVIARRNRYYAGTRYLKRGINNDGNVANDVETEQILEEISTSSSEQPNISSFIHIRGSVPLFWHQEQNSILPKPDIKLNLSDIQFDATKRHFHLLSKRYGYPSLVCNLTKAKEGKKKQETLLNEWYLAAIEYINANPSLKEEEKIVYCHYDLKSLRQRPKFYKDYCEESCKLIAKTNMFCFTPHIMDNAIYILSLQKGVIRSNCIDCLDRTNVYQQIIGTAVMVIQLRNLGIEATEPDNEYEEIYGILTEIYKKMGNELSSQYAGSLAHKQTIRDNRSKVNKMVQKIPEMMNTFKRYFNNSFNDQHKQNSINLLLGKYKYYPNYPNLWDLENDADLHRKVNLKQLGDNWAEEGMNYYTKFNLINDIMDQLSNCENMKHKEKLLALGMYFNLDILEKIQITKYKKLIPILTSSAYESYLNSRSLDDQQEGTITDTYDYLIRLDKYLEYKRTDVMRHYETIAFQKETPLFSFLDIDPKTQIKTFEKFKYGELFEKEKPMNDIEPWEPMKRISDVRTLYDETTLKGISSVQFKVQTPDIHKRKSKREVVFKEVLYMKKNDREMIKTSDIFNVCSFDLKENIEGIIRDFMKPVFKTNLFTGDDKEKEEFKTGVYKEEFDSLHKPINHPEFFEEDLENKMNILELTLPYHPRKEVGYNYYDRFEPSSPLHKLQKKNSRREIMINEQDESLASILKNSLQVEIEENHFGLD